MTVNSLRRVKFIAAGSLRYGFVVAWKPKRQQPLLPSEVQVRDAITPQTWIVDKQQVYDIDEPEAGGVDEYEVYIQQQYRNAQELSDSVEGCGVGKLLRFPVLDHWAYYVIAKTSPRLVHLEWRGFDSSCRAVHPAYGYSCKQPRCEILRHIEIEEYLHGMLRNTL